MRLNGSRSEEWMSPAPIIDIANGAPTGAGATYEILRTWVDSRDSVNHEHVDANSGYETRLALCSGMGRGRPFNSTSPTSTNLMVGFCAECATSSLTKTSPDPA